MARAIVVGAGMVGLASAWHLQERGYDVTVVDKSGVAAGSSWGNAGWLTPAKALPLAEPGLWKYAPRALFDRSSAMYMPFSWDIGHWLFLARFASRGTLRGWNRTMAALVPLNNVSLAAFDELAAGGVEGTVTAKPFVVGFTDQPAGDAFLREVDRIRAAGQEIEVNHLPDPESLTPHLSDEIRLTYRLEGQRFIEPGPYVETLADAVRARGGVIRSGAKVIDVADGPLVRLADGEVLEADAVVVAIGSWLPALSRKLGVRVGVHAGRGYSFTVPSETPAQVPVYLPVQRAIVTPYQGRIRLGGTMEFAPTDAPLSPRRIQAILDTVRPLLRGMDLEARQDEWVGPRPVSTDGLPLIGASRISRIYVNGGHGMWGMLQGPASGRLLAELIATGERPDILSPFDPLR